MEDIPIKLENSGCTEAYSSKNEIPGGSEQFPPEIPHFWNSLPIRADLVLFNPPYCPGLCAELGGIDRALSGGGEDGRKVIDAFVDRLQTLIAPGGAALLVCIEANGLDAISERCRARGFAAVARAEKRLPSEHLYVLEVREAPETE